MNDINEQLKEIAIEDFIWIIFIFTSIAALLSDNFEKKWLLTKNKKDYVTYKEINIVLLIISFLVYLYFFIINYKKYKQAHQTGTIKDMFFNDINFVAASLFLIAGLLNLYTETADNDITSIFL